MTSPRSRPTAARYLDLNGRKLCNNVNCNSVPVVPCKYRNQFSYLYEETEHQRVVERLMKHIIHLEDKLRNVETKGFETTKPCNNEAKTSAITEEIETLRGRSICIPGPGITKIVKTSGERRIIDVPKDCNDRFSPPVISCTKSKVAALREFFEGGKIPNSMSPAGVVQVTTTKPSNQLDDINEMRYNLQSGKHMLALEQKNKWLQKELTSTTTKHMISNRDQRKIDQAMKTNKKLKMEISKLIAVRDGQYSLRIELEKTQKKLRAEKKKSKMLYKTIWPDL